MVQEFCAELLQQLSEGVLALMQSQSETRLKSLGLASVKDKYLSKRFHRRWYDPNKTLSQSIGVLYSLPPEGLAAVCLKVSDSFGLMGLYSYVCSQIDKVPQSDDLLAISRASMFHGVQEGESLLVSMVGVVPYEKFLDAFKELVSGCGETPVRQYMA